jgi:hypothetical protein
MVNKWLNIYFSQNIAGKIKKDKKLIKLLIRGIDIEGELIVIKKNNEYPQFIDFIKDNHGMAIDYASTFLALFSEKLYCDTVSDAIKNCYSYLETKNIPYSTARGEILIGELNSDQPIIAGIMITEATKKLLSKTVSG